MLLLGNLGEKDWVYEAALENEYVCGPLLNKVELGGRLISISKPTSDMGEEEPRKVHTIGVRVDSALLKLLQDEADRRGETVANYVRVSAKMRVTGQLVEPTKKRLNEF